MVYRCLQIYIKFPSISYLPNFPPTPVAAPVPIILPFYYFENTFVAVLVLVTTNNYHNFIHSEHLLQAFLPSLLFYKPVDNLKDEFARNSKFKRRGYLK